MPDSSETRSRAAKSTAGPGRLIAVTCADAGRLDVLLHAAAKHLGQRLTAEVIQPLATCRLPAGGGTVVKPSQFCKLAGKGEVLVSWRDGPHLFGFPGTVLERLAAGLDVVIGTPAHLEQTLRAMWPETIILRLAAGTEPLRHRLSPQATIARTASIGTRHGLSEPLHAAAFNVRIEDSRDPAIAVRRLASAIANSLPHRLPNRAVVAVGRSAARDLERGRTTRAKLRPATGEPVARRRDLRSDLPVLV